MTCNQIVRYEIFIIFFLKRKFLKMFYHVLRIVKLKYLQKISLKNDNPLLQRHSLANTQDSETSEKLRVSFHVLGIG